MSKKKTGKKTPIVPKITDEYERDAWIGEYQLAAFKVFCERVRVDANDGLDLDMAAAACKSAVEMADIMMKELNGDA